MNLILFGPPGVGKGTQATHLTAKYGLRHISTGDILRAAIAAGTPLGKLAKQHVESGGLVPDDVIIGLVGEVLKEVTEHKGFLLDGFPRTVEQAKALEVLFAELGVADLHILMLEAPEEELIKRMVKRGLESGRKDDTEETIRHRLNVYLEQTQPVKLFYDAKRGVTVVDGLGTVEEITARLVKQLA